MGWQPIFVDPVACCQKTINFVHPLLVVMMILLGYAIQYAACFHRDSPEVSARKLQPQDNFIIYVGTIILKMLPIFKRAAVGRLSNVVLAQKLIQLSRAIADHPYLDLTCLGYHLVSHNKFYCVRIIKISKSHNQPHGDLQVIFKRCC